MAYNNVALKESFTSVQKSTIAPSETGSVRARIMGGVDVDMEIAGIEVINEATNELIRLDNMGCRLNLEIQDVPYEALMKIADGFREFGLSNALSSPLVEAIENYALHLGTDFTRKANPTPLKIHLYITDQKPELDESLQHFMVAFDGQSMFGGEFSKMNVGLGISGTTSSQTNVPDLDKMFQSGKTKYLVFHYETLATNTLDGLNTVDASLANLVQAAGPGASAQSLSAIKQSIEQSTITLQQTALIENVAQLNQVVESARANAAASAEIIPIVAELKGKIEAIIQSSPQGHMPAVLVEAATQSIQKPEVKTAVSKVITAETINAYPQNAVDVPKAGNENKPATTVAKPASVAEVLPVIANNDNKVIDKPAPAVRENNIQSTVLSTAEAPKAPVKTPVQAVETSTPQQTATVKEAAPVQTVQAETNRSIVTPVQQAPATQAVQSVSDKVTTPAAPTNKESTPVASTKENIAPVAPAPVVQDRSSAPVVTPQAVVQQVAPAVVDKAPVQQAQTTAKETTPVQYAAPDRPVVVTPVQQTAAPQTPAAPTVPDKTPVNLQPVRENASVHQPVPQAPAAPAAPAQVLIDRSLNTAQSVKAESTPRAVETPRSVEPAKSPVQHDAPRADTSRSDAPSQANPSVKPILLVTPAVSIEKGFTPSQPVTAPMPRTNDAASPIIKDTIARTPLNVSLQAPVAPSVPVSRGLESPPVHTFRFEPKPVPQQYVAPAAPLATPFSFAPKPVVPSTPPASPAPAPVNVAPKPVPVAPTPPVNNQPQIRPEIKPNIVAKQLSVDPNPKPAQPAIVPIPEPVKTKSFQPVEIKVPAQKIGSVAAAPVDEKKFVLVKDKEIIISSLEKQAKANPNDWEVKKAINILRETNSLPESVVNKTFPKLSEQDQIVWADGLRDKARVEARKEYEPEQPQTKPKIEINNTAPTEIKTVFKKKCSITGADCENTCGEGCPVMASALKGIETNEKKRLGSSFKLDTL